VDQITRIFSGFSPLSLLDILAVTAVIFWFLRVVRGTRAIQLIRGVAVLLIIAYLAGTYLRLSTLNWLIRTSIPALVISIPVIFQPELRRALEQL
jgi:diadenylate cyclase